MLQGLILGPLFLNIDINGIEHNLIVPNLVYADDMENFAVMIDACKCLILQALFEVRE